MAGNFVNYSAYYDLLYRDKDYESETSYLVQLFDKYCPNHSKNVLELGCGTGGHANQLSQKGYQVLGIDYSETMIDIAKKKHGTNRALNFEVSDIRFFNDHDDRKYDLVCSLFHVVSYLNLNSDLVAAFKTAKNHLIPGGIFVFDCWYGPAVLTDSPSVRYKDLENELVKIRRISVPSLRCNENVVDVEFKVMIVDKVSNSVTEIDELHSMRYLFIPEISNLLGQSGLRLIKTFEWLKEEDPSQTSWNIVCVAGF